MLLMSLTRSRLMILATVWKQSVDSSPIRKENAPLIAALWFYVSCGNSNSTALAVNLRLARFTLAWGIRFKQFTANRNSVRN